MLVENLSRRRSGSGRPAERPGKCGQDLLPTELFHLGQKCQRFLPKIQANMASTFLLLNLMKNLNRWLIRSLLQVYQKGQESLLFSLWKRLSTAHCVPSSVSIGFRLFLRLGGLRSVSSWLWKLQMVLSFFGEYFLLAANFELQIQIESNHYGQLWIANLLKTQWTTCDHM